MSGTGSTVTSFLTGAEVVADALASPEVASAWDRPSVLADQLVSGLAGHLARGGVWVVDDYLEASRATGPINFENAAQYFAAFVDTAAPATHVAIRERGAAVAAIGHRELASTLRTRLDALALRLESLPGDQVITVIGGNRMRLDDYLLTLIVEQVVHLDDLARSVERASWTVPAALVELAIGVGIGIATRASGGQAVLGALFREGFASLTFPVL